MKTLACRNTVCYNALERDPKDMHQTYKISVSAGVECEFELSHDEPMAVKGRRGSISEESRDL